MKERANTERGAAEWFLAIHAEKDPAPETLQAWLHWMDSSPDNREAFEDITQVWQRTPSAVIPRTVDSAIDDYDGSIPIAEWRARQQKPGLPRHAPAPVALHAGSQDRRVLRRRLVTLAAAASLFAIALFIYWGIHSAAIVEGDFATRTGQQRELMLADGSRVTLGAHSRVVVDLRKDVRVIRLEAGEAYFSVHKDPGRPFVVNAFESKITAVGTAFNVRAVRDRVTVTVSEGSVKVTDLKPVSTGLPIADAASGSNDDASRENALLKRGQQLTFTRHSGHNAEAASVRSVDAQESIRWRDGWLVYRDEPLRYVIADIERYTDVNVAVSDSAADVRFSGAVFKDNIAEWIAALPNVAAVEVSRDAAGFNIAAR